MTPWVGLLEPVSHVNGPHQCQWNHLCLALYSTENIKIQEEKSRRMWSICPIKSFFLKENISKASKVVKQKIWQRQQNTRLSYLCFSKWVYVASGVPGKSGHYPRHRYYEAGVSGRVLSCPGLEAPHEKFHGIPVSSVRALGSVQGSKMDVIESLFLQVSLGAKHLILPLIIIWYPFQCLHKGT